MELKRVDMLRQRAEKVKQGEKALGRGAGAKL
jgi:hypothetical protein